MSNIVKINAMPESMNTKEIAKATGKVHGHVLRDTRVMLVTLYGGTHVDRVIPADKVSQRGQFIWDNADMLFRAVFVDGAVLDHQQNQGFTLHWDSRGYLSSVALNRSLTMTLASGYDIILRNRVMNRLEELEKKLAAPKAIPYTTGRGDTLTGEEAEELRDMLTDGVERLPKATQGKAMKQGWSKLVAHFKVETYRKIPRAEFREALSLIGRHLAGLEAKVPGLPVPQPDSLHRALDSMNLMAESVANMAEAIVHLSRGSPPRLEKGEGLTAPTVSPSNEKRTAPTVQTS